MTATELRIEAREARAAARDMESTGYFAVLAANLDDMARDFDDEADRLDAGGRPHDGPTLVRLV